MPAIDHVVVLMLENRSFDHMLGFLDHPDPAFDGLLRGGPYTNPGWQGAAPVAASAGAKAVLPVDPDHSHDAVMRQLGLAPTPPYGAATNQGFVTDFERGGRGLVLPRFTGLFGPLVNWWVRYRAAAGTPVVGRGPLAMLCQAPERVPVLSRLALDFAVCTRWFCPVPGETWPNRNFAHAATSDGETDIDVRFYPNPTIFELLEAHGRDWRVYHDDTPQVWAFPRLWDTPARHANWFPFARFAEHCAAGTLPAYSFIEPNHQPPMHTLDHAPIVGRPDVSDSQHPGNNLVTDAAYDDFDDAADTDFARGETLIASVYESLRAQPDLFARTLLVITYDEHGGLYDHVAPPRGVPAPGKPSRGASFAHLFLEETSAAFDFSMLGPRVPAVVVSPLIAAGTVDATVRDHAAIPATLRALFAPNAEPLTARDAWAPPVHDLLTLDEPRTADLPDLSAYATPEAGGEGPAAEITADLAALPSKVPEYYRDFLRQAELVWNHLARLDEPETAGSLEASEPRRATQITGAFVAAAQRHRSGDAPQ